MKILILRVDLDALQVEGGWLIVWQLYSIMLDFSVSQNRAVVADASNQRRVDHRCVLHQKQQLATIMCPDCLVVEGKVIFKVLSRVNPLAHWRYLFGASDGPTAASSFPPNLELNGLHSIEICNKINLV